MNLTNKNIILTGAASGIGKSLLEQLLIFEGIKIIAVDINPIVSDSQKVISYVCDLTKEKEIDDLFEFALKNLPQIDIFIANAGFAYYEQLTKPNWGRIERIFQLNVFSPIYSYLKMKELNYGREYGVIITASAMAKTAIPGYALYGATKAALDRFEEAIVFEPQDLGYLGLVYPIATKSNFFANSTQKQLTDVPVPFPSQTPDEVAKAIIKGIQGNKRHIYPSKFYQVMRFVQWLSEKMVVPYQKYYSKAFKQWLSSTQK
jgi:uncharacterized protein